MKNGRSNIRGMLLGASCFSALLSSSPSWSNAPDGAPRPGENTTIVDASKGQASGSMAGDVNGIAQIVIFNQPGAGTANLCTGTLINPRTVLFAAHCVNSQAASAYGSGGSPVAVSFGPNNLGAVAQWLGLGSGGKQKASGNGLYGVEQVWFDPRSLRPESNGFMVADLALATLDAPAFDVPTWALLFSPLDGPTHATVTGYGVPAGAASPVAGSGAEQSAVDWRRRSAENMISLLGSFADRDKALFGLTSAVTNNLYMLSLTDPNSSYNPSAGKFDFGIFGDKALPGEGGAVPGDSGSPLIVDKKYSRPVVAGVLSGVARFFPEQQLKDFGTVSFYQPLHLYWDAIVANNSYVYAANVAGHGDWEDPAHWVKLLDPNYFVDVGGKLVNALPGAPAQGISPGGAKFGQICFLASCTTLKGEAAASSAVAPSGPAPLGSLPDNVKARPGDGIKARYYDVTLSAPGTTRLSSAVTIDKMAVDGPTKLDIRPGGALRVLGEFNQLRGWTHVDGTLASGRDMLFASGLVSGSGTVQAPFVTVVGASVAPGGVNRAGTLNVSGNLILSSGSSLLIDAARGSADRLVVDGILSLSGGKSDGAAIIFSPLAGRPVPRHGESQLIASATGGVQGAFGTVLHGFQGVLRPELRYSGNEVTAHFRASSLAQFLKERGATELAFAGALDALRGGSYERLAQLYGTVDLMDAEALGRTLRGIAPTAVANEALYLERAQSRVMLDAITGRLSSIASGEAAGRLAVLGEPEALMGWAGSQQPEHIFSASLGSSAKLQEGRSTSTLPAHLSGFVSAGVSRQEARLRGDRGHDAGQRAWHFGMGLETAVSPDLTIGTAMGYSDGYARASSGEARARSKMSQLAVYGSYRFAGAGYLAGVASVERNRGGTARQAAVGEFTSSLQGVTQSRRYNALVETGVNFDVGGGLKFSPHAQLSYQSYRLNGFREAGAEIAMVAGDLKLEQIDAKLGGKLAGTAALGGGWTVAPQLQLDWVRRLSGSKNQLQVRFANAAEVPIVLPLAAEEGSWAEIGGRVGVARGKLEFSAGGTFGIDRSGARDDRAVADLVLRF